MLPQPVRARVLFISLFSMIVLTMPIVPHASATIITAPSASDAAPAATDPIPPPQGLEHLSSIGGHVDKIVVSGSVAYLAEGGALTILDVSNPAQPVRRSQFLFSGVIGALAVVGSRAYVAYSYRFEEDAYEVRLAVLDVRDGSYPGQSA